MKVEFLNLYLHTNEELVQILGNELLKREKLHHWPLSYVEKVTTNDGNEYIYKSQKAISSVEKSFYKHAKAKFLIEPLYMGNIKDCDILILPYIYESNLSHLSLSAENLKQKIASMNLMIQQFKDVPIYYDLSTHEKGIELLNGISTVLKNNGVTTEQLNRLTSWMEDEAKSCWKSEVGLVHSDLSGDNVLIDKHGEYKYILDWQRPMVAPLELDIAMGLRLAGFDCSYMGNINKLAIFVNILWYAQCYEKWLPFDNVIEMSKKYINEFCSIG